MAEDSRRVGFLLLWRDHRAHQGFEGGHPLLVIGSFGKGRTMAWTSDIGPHWLTNDFVNWPGYAKLWRQSLAWLTSK